MALDLDEPLSETHWMILLGILTLTVGMAMGTIVTYALLSSPDHHKEKSHDIDITIVTDATLTQFDYINNNNNINTLYYNLALNVTVSNLVKGYDFIEAGASYQDVTFGSSILKPFNDSINELNAVFKGQHDGLSLSTKQTLKDNISGVYLINVKLCLRLRAHTYGSPMVRCDLHVPLKSHKEVNEFHATRCDYLGYHDGCSIE